MGRHVRNFENCRIHVKTRNAEEKKKWVEFAKENDMTLTELIRSAVLKFTNPPKESLNSPELKRKVLELKDQLKECRTEVELKKRTIKTLMSDIEALKNKAFVEDTMGHHTFGKKLVETFKECNRPLREYELFKFLEIDRNDLNNTKGLANQLKNLEDLGLVEFTAHGWRWLNE